MKIVFNIVFGQGSGHSFVGNFDSTVHCTYGTVHTSMVLLYLVQYSTGIPAAGMLFSVNEVLGHFKPLPLSLSLCVGTKTVS